MNDKSYLRRLDLMASLNIDASAAYKEALDEVSDPDVWRRLEGFRADHERHIKELSGLIRQADAVPPQRNTFGGYLLEGFADIMSGYETSGALRAMRSNEKYINVRYEDALEWGMEGEAMEIIERQYEDETRHLSYIQKELQAERVKV